MGILDLEQQLAFYRAYHSDSRNVAIHVVCIPLLLLTSFLLMSNFAILPQNLLMDYVPGTLLPYFNIGILLSLIYAAFYILLDPMFGLLVAPGLIYVSVHSTQLVRGLDGKYYNTVAFTIWVVAWLLQFVGHGVFEGRAPALLDSLSQALLLAPFFVVFEVADFLGFRKEVFQRVDAIVKPRLEKFRQEREQRRSSKARSD